MNRIVIELTPEDQSRLDALTAAVKALTEAMGTRPDCSACVQTVAYTAAQVAKDPETIHQIVPPAAEPKPEPAETPTETTPEPAEAPTAPVKAVEPPDLATFKGLVAKYMADNPSQKKALAGYIKNTIGAAGVMSVPEDKRLAVLEHLGVRWEK